MQANYELEIQSALNSAREQNHPSHNPSVARCCEAYNARYRAVLATRDHPEIARREAREAYRKAMPPLSSPQNVGDFIACVAHATLIEAIDGSDAARLLYAAQIAHRVLKNSSPQQKLAY
jgi:hypothetical protein